MIVFIYMIYENTLVNNETRTYYKLTAGVGFQGNNYEFLERLSDDGVAGVLPRWSRPQFINGLTKL